MTEQRETRARRKIREAVEARGWHVDDPEDIGWEPIAPGSEMAGAAGGWEVWISDKHGESVDVVLGYSWQEVVENIDALPETPSHLDTLGK